MKCFISSFKRALNMMKNGVHFIVITLLVAELFKILIYANKMTRDVTLWTQWCKITRYGISVQILQGWNLAGLMCCKNYTLNFLILVMGQMLKINCYPFMVDLWLCLCVCYKILVCYYSGTEFDKDGWQPWYVELLLWFLM